MLSVTAFAQQFTATVDNNTVSTDQQFKVTFTFSGKDINGLSNFHAPDFKNFMILSGPNQSTSMQIINGAVSASKAFYYYVQPQKTGKYEIGSASVEYDGKTYNSNPITITVEKGSPKSQASGSNGSQNSQTISDKEIGENLFVRATVDREKVYLGEQVTVTYKLYTRLSIASQMSVNKLPSYEGFWAEEIDVPNNINFSTEMYKGKQYRVGLLKKVALFPSQTGDLSVTPFVLNVPVQIRQQRKSGNIFDNFFNDPFFNNSRTVNYTAKSNTIRLKVEPLPSKDVPKSYNGAVGNFSMSADLNKDETTTNESITLKIKINGTGNIQLLNMPEINLPPGMDKYDPKISQKVNRTGMISGTKTAEYLIVPRTAGKKVIPPVKFTYFDPSKRAYETLETKSFTVNVAQGSGTVAQGGSGMSKEDVKLLGQDIRYIKTSYGDITEQQGVLLFHAGFWVAAGLPLLLLAGLITWKRREDKLAGNIQLLRFQKADKVARTRLKTAKGLMQENNQTAFYTEMSQALFGYLEDKLRIPKSEISLERAVEKLNKLTNDEGLLTNLKECADQCEYARFAPSGNGKAAMNEMYDKMAGVIIELEKLLATKKYA